MTAETDLLPCPFCNAPAERIDFGPGDAENEGGSCISCTQCQSSGPVEFGYKENFVSNWNRRTAPPSAPVGVEWLPQPFGYVEPRPDLSGYEVFDEPAPRRAAIWNMHGMRKALAQTRAHYSIDADPDGIRERVADAITGALSFGAQGAHKPPAGHWLEPFWDMARAEAAPPSAPVGFDSWWHQQMPNLASGDEPDDRAIAAAAWAAALAQQPAAVDEAMVERMVEAFLASTGQVHAVTQLQRDLTTTCMKAALAAQPGGSDNDR
ncbi:MAG TPA: Lar family restriction alleviation protein [Rhodocyclaceae bacterium]|nr:Lar family restriction alleviation protein [Rhodocyclaceae bacterium]